MRKTWMLLCAIAGLAGCGVPEGASAPGRQPETIPVPCFANGMCQVASDELDCFGMGGVVGCPQKAQPPHGLDRAATPELRRCPVDGSCGPNFICVNRICVPSEPAVAMPPPSGCMLPGEVCVQAPNPGACLSVGGTPAFCTPGGDAEATSAALPSPPPLGCHLRNGSCIEVPNAAACGRLGGSLGLCPETDSVGGPTR